MGGGLSRPAGLSEPSARVIRAGESREICECTIRCALRESRCQPGSERATEALLPGRGHRFAGRAACAHLFPKRCGAYQSARARFERITFRTFAAYDGDT